MSMGGAQQSREIKLRKLIGALHEIDSRIDDSQLQDIISSGSQAVPLLEDILRNALEQGSLVSLKTPQRDNDWFAVIHALYLLAELRSHNSLELVLTFLAQKQNVLDYWLHELLDEDVWEVIFAIGHDRLDKLESFVLDQTVNNFSRLSVCTALVQIALHFPEKQSDIIKIFKKVLRLKENDLDFTGLVVSELLDFKQKALIPDLSAALKKNHVWAGIISVDEVNLCYRKGRVRKLKPLNIFERYNLFRQYTNITIPSRNELTEKTRRHILPNVLNRF
ncbi:MAG: DUF1186 domain-containing protein [bacterium]